MLRVEVGAVSCSRCACVAHKGHARETGVLFSAAHQQISSSPAAIASRRRGNDLGTMITYLRRATGDVSGNNGLSATLNYLRRAAGNGRAQR
jgi:hypothetical protein